MRSIGVVDIDEFVEARLLLQENLQQLVWWLFSSK
jgi:hypothetical protein